MQCTPSHHMHSKKNVSDEVFTFNVDIFTFFLKFCLYVYNRKTDYDRTCQVKIISRNFFITER